MAFFSILLSQTDSSRVDSIHIDCSQDPWFGQDKVLHTTGSLVMVLGVDKIEGMNTQSVVMGPFAIGLLKEVYDKKYGSGCFSLKDIFADTIGIIIGFLIISNTG